MMPAAAVEQIAKCLALTVNDFDGEALAAVKAANRILKQHGMSWHELLVPRDSESDAPPRYQPPRDDDPLWLWPARWEMAVAFCASHSDLLNQPSRDFIDGLTDCHRMPSERQLQWLRRCTEHIQFRRGKKAA